MNISNEFPPNIEAIRKRFDIPNTVVFTYGDTLYNPFNGGIDDALIAHEKTHTKQQGDNPEAWWERYLKDDAFRLEQEVQAYRNQYRFKKSQTKDRNKLFLFARSIAGDLSSKIYGNMIGFIEAYSLITS